MSKPSFENIDRWFFEYSEGNLSPAQVQEFESFLAKNPELQEELSLWEDAQVTAPKTDDVAVAALKRPMVPTVTILTYSGIAVIGILIGFGLSYYFQEQPVYAKQTVDTSIIQVGDEPLFANKVLIEKSGSVESENVEILKKDGNKVHETKAKYTTHTKLDDDRIIANESNSSNVAESNNAGSNVKSDDHKNATQKLDDQSLAQIDLHDEIQVEAKDLPEIKKYLNGTRSDALENTIAAEGTAKKKVEVSTGLKRKLKSVFRKIKRMADQPIALKNTKDQYFHVPMMTGFSANYGMVGSAKGNRLQLTSRNQWAGHANQQLQNTVSWDGYVYALRGGLGVDVTYNQYQKDAIQNYAAALTYSPKFSINNNVSIEPALRFKMGAVDVNNNSSVLGSNIEMNRSNITPLFVNGDAPIGSKLWYRDVGAGLMLNTKWFYAGLNVDNIGRHYDNYYSSDISGSHKASTHLTGIIGTEYESLTKDMKLSGYALYQNYGDLNEVWGGVNAQFRWIQAGVATSSNLGLAASLGVVLDKVSLHYNLDKTESVLKGEKLLSHQLTMRILMKPSRYAAKFLNM